MARTLRSTGPIGIAMSGGLDSCSVAHVAAHLLHAKGQRLTSFTNVPRAGWRGPVRRGRYADERPRVELLRRSLPNLECEFVSLDEANGEGAVDRSFAFGGQPPRNPCNLQWLDLIDERAAARGIRVLLSGGLGNATTGWDGRAGLHDRFRALRWRSLWHEIRALGGDSLRRRARLLVGAAMPHLEQCVELYRHGQLNRHPWRVHSSLRPGAEDSLGLRAQWRSSGFHPSSLQPGTGRGSRIHAIESIVANDLLVHDTVARAASGVDHRDPTGDVRLLEFCLALPPEQYLEGGVERRLIRRAMTGKLPDAIVWGKGRGEQAADWFDDVRAAEDRIREDLERFEQLPLARSLLDLPRMRALAEALPDPSRAADREVFQSYRLLLQRGVTMGRYIRWFEGENA